MKTFSPTRLAGIKPVQFRAKCERIHPQRIENFDLSRFAAGLAQHFARMSAYFGSRHLGHNHDKAVKESQRVVTALRRALGYTDPKDSFSF